MTRKTSIALKRTNKKDEWAFVEVIWNDAQSDNEWLGSDDLPNLACIVSRGWFVRELENSITLAASIGGHSKQAQVGEVITIPRGCIVSMTDLKV